MQVADAVYHANAHVLLQGDACFRFEELPARGGLTLQLMDADKMDAPPGAFEWGDGARRWWGVIGAGVACSERR